MKAKNIFTGLFFIVILAGFTLCANAQTTKTVGATGADYTTLRSAFIAINSGLITGAITLQIIDNTTELDSAVLYQSGYTGAGGTSSYTSVNIYPTVSGKTISCNLEKPLIDLRGTSNVTIDGRLNGEGTTKDLTLTNTSTSNVTNTWTSTIRFIDGACNNTIKYCVLKGSGTLQFSGIVLFSSSTRSTGNNNNLIDNNDITNEGNNRPTMTICSVGSSGKDNTNNIISNNNIFNVLKQGSATLYTMAIGMHSYTTGYTITGNSIYETTSFVSNNTSLPHYAIYIANPLSTSTCVNIYNNYIGGSAPNCGGTPWVHSASGSNNEFTAIYLDVKTVITSNVQGNTISNFAYSNSSSANWIGIYVKNGNVNIGTTSANTIGSPTGNASITYTAGATGAMFYGISNASTGIVDIRNNKIGSIIVANSNSTYATHFYGIYSSATSGTLTVKNNLLGSTDAGTSNSIDASSTSTSNAQKVIGIYSAASSSSPVINVISNTISKLRNRVTGTLLNSVTGIYAAYGIHTIMNNTINDLTIDDANNTSANNSSCIGITMTSTTASSQNVSGNTIYNLKNTNATFAGSVIGLYYMGNNSAASTNNIYGNFIYGLSATGASSTTANLYGIKIESGASTYFNNIINITDNTLKNVYGIYENGTSANNNKLYFNTVYLSGTLASGTNKSYALYSSASTNIRNIRNNIFSNTRSTTGGTNLHYAAYFNYAVSTNLTLDYNNYFAPGTGGVLGFYSGTNVNVLPLITGSDANSNSINPLFSSAGSTNPLDYLPNALLIGLAGTEVSNDFSNFYRDVPPKMGAVETQSPNTAIDVYNGETLLASYPHISTAVDKINDGTHTGNLTVKINRTQVLYSNLIIYASGTGGSNYSSVSFYPTRTGLSINGTLATYFIDLDGADNITFDGRVNGTGTTKDMSIINSSIASTASTIRFVNNASYNTIKYCFIKGSSTTLGIIYFAGTNTSVGNNYNTIDNNDITSAIDASRPYNVVYSLGIFGIKNGFNTVSNNNIYNFLNRGNASYGINLQNYNTDWTISGNSFYETASFIPTASVEYRIINIYNVTELGDNYNISGNYIGGTSPYCGTGGAITSFTKTNSYDNVFKAIYYNAGGNTGAIQNNVIKNITWTNKNVASNFDNIYVLSGSANITGNVIGDTTGTGSITFTAANTSTLYAINIQSSGTINCSNNLIGSITAANIYTTAATHLYGIYKNFTAGTTTINNNFIGSLGTTNSLNASCVNTTGQQLVYGVRSDGTGTNTISGNIISNITNGTTSTGFTSGDQIFGIYTLYGTNTVTNNTVKFLTISNSTTGSTTTASIAGIVTCATTGAQTISNNTISNLTNNNSAFTGCVIGIYCYGPVEQNAVSGNMIHSLSVHPSTTAATLYGINMGQGKTIYSNNIISLGGDTKTTIYGISEYGPLYHDTYVYFNTIKISGNLASGATNKSYCIYGSTQSNNRDMRNNILCNTRSTVSGTSKHYALYFTYTTSTYLTLGYNDYYASGTGGVIGFYGNANKTTVPIVTGLDAGSVTTNPSFPANKENGTSAADFKPGVTMTGIAGTGVTTDYTGYTRTTPPTLGALDYNNPMPVELASFNSSVSGCNVKLNWITSSEQNNAGFEIERAGIRQQATGNWEKIGYVQGKGTTNTQTAYTFSDTKLISGKYQYRLKQIDNNGNFEYHNLNGVVEVGVPTKYEMSQNYPNPFNPMTKIDFQLPNDGKVSLKIYDITGREIATLVNNEFKKADFYTVMFNGSSLSSGVYFYRITADKYVATKKMVLVK